MTKIRLIRITTIPISLKKLLTGQMRFMNENGLEVIMMSSNGVGLEELKKAEGVPHIIIPMTRKITPFQDLYSLFVLIYHFIKIKPDIVHSHTPKAGLIAMLASKIVGVPIRVHTIAGLRFMTASGFKRKILVLMEKLTYWAANYVWANSFSILEYVKKHNLCKLEKLDIIGKGSSNGIDLEQFSSKTLNQETIDYTKSLINYSSENIYILSVGRMVKDKGIEELVSAFTDVQQHHKNLKLILLGPFEDNLDPLSSDTKFTITNNQDIIHIGWSDNVEYFMYLADLLIHPSHREGFPNVLLQAGAMECPIICSNIEGNIDIVTNKETGLLFQVKNIKHLVVCLRKALEDRDTLDTYKKKLLTEIRAKYDRKIVHKLLLDKYIRIFNKKYVPPLS